MVTYKQKEGLKRYQLFTQNSLNNSKEGGKIIICEDNNNSTRYRAAMRNLD